MQTIYKYQLEMNGTEVIDVPDVPVGAELLDVQFQTVGYEPTGDGRAELFAWFLIDTDESRTVSRRFIIATTGNGFPWVEANRHITTVQRNRIVLHIFDGGVV